jgi:hypothetical protein
MNKRTIVGFIITLGWIWVAYSIHGIAKDSTLTLNEWGDFLAGVMAPLALFWLVLGYFQQGEELSQNTKALELQARELALQTKETQNLVKETARQTELTKLELEHSLKIYQSEEKRKSEAAKPRFILQGHSIGGNKIEQTFINMGGKITDLFVNTENENAKNIDINPKNLLDHQGIGNISFHLTGSTNNPVLIDIFYTDSLGFNSQAEYLWTNKEKKFNIT